MADENTTPETEQAPVDKYPAMTALRKELEATRAKLLAQTQELEAQRDAVRAKAQPLEAEEKALNAKIRKIHHEGPVTLGELDNQIAAIHRATGAKSLAAQGA